MSDLLTRVAESPPGETFWEGSWSMPGTSDIVRYYICCTESDTPTKAQLALRDHIQEHLEALLDVARKATLTTAIVSPTAFGIASEEVLELRSLASHTAPFEGPEITIYDGSRWFVRFAATRFAACSVLGVGVDFVGDSPERCYCLDDHPVVAS